MLYSDYVSYTGDKEQVENVMSATQCAELKEMAKQWIQIRYTAIQMGSVSI